MRKYANGFLVQQVPTRIVQGAMRGHTFHIGFPRFPGTFDLVCKKIARNKARATIRGDTKITSSNELQVIGKIALGEG